MSFGSVIPSLACDVCREHDARFHLTDCATSGDWDRVQDLVGDSTETGINVYSDSVVVCGHCQEELARLGIRFDHRSLRTYD